MKKFDINQLELYEADPPHTRQNKILVDEENVDSPPFSVGMGIYREGEGAEMHAHENEYEVMIFTNGTGICRLENGEEIKLTEGTVLYFPPGEAHKLMNTGEDNLEFYFLYSPPGPEAGIRNWKTV